MLEVMLIFLSIMYFFIHFRAQVSNTNKNFEFSLKQYTVLTKKVVIQKKKKIYNQFLNLFRRK